MSKKQMDRAVQLENQLRLRQAGVCRDLVDLLKANSINLSKAEMDQLKTIKNRFLKRLKDESNEFLLSLVENEFSDIEDHIEGSVSDAFSRMFSAENPVLCLDLLSIDSRGPVAKSKIEHSFSSHFSSPTIFAVGSDGSWNFLTYDSFSRSGNFERADSLASLLEDLMAEPLAVDLRIARYQSSQIAELARQVTHKIVEMDLYLAQSENLWLDYENVIDMQIGLTNTFEKELKSILSKDQMQMLNERLARYAIAQKGFRLGDDVLAKHFGLSQQRVKEFRGLQKKAADKISTFTLDFFIDYAKSVMNSIQDERAKTIINSHYGKIVPFGSATLLLIEFDLQNEGN